MKPPLNAEQLREAANGLHAALQKRKINDANDQLYIMCLAMGEVIGSWPRQEQNDILKVAVGSIQTTIDELDRQKIEDAKAKRSH